MIRARHINKFFGEQNVLKDVSLEFHPGKCNLIIGQSGSGKTVLMKCLVGLHEPDSGDIYFDDYHFTAMNFREKIVVRRQIGMVFQGGALFDSMSVLENVQFPLSMFTDLSSEEKLERAQFCLDRVNLPNVNKLFPSELSGGMKKRVAIARAIAMNPRYLFCDEPNSGLDPKTAIVIDNLIHEITQEYNMITIVNTHDMNSVFEIGDTVAFIHEGHLWWEGDNKSILDSGNPELDDFVYASELIRKLRH
jgi:phospholipid/cholesterol/gamma-HCH transport system ATP-binding protein